MQFALADYSAVTEIAGDEVTQEQIERIAHRYTWASKFCTGKDVLEVACGSGQGLELIGKQARSLKAGDYSEPLLARCKQEYNGTFELRQFDAQAMPYPDRSFDVIILFEALYYLPAPEKFVAECKRLLRSDGLVLFATANKDLFDFNPSPYSYRYFGVVELRELFEKHSFAVECFGHARIAEASARQKILRPMKAAASSLGLIPKTMAGKKLLKRLMFGKLVVMPRRITEDHVVYSDPTRLPLDAPDRNHKVIYCKATLQ
jgi:SAM-dependent methyltransferase